MSHVVFPGDPEYDAPNPTRAWHYAIMFAAMAVVGFALVVFGFTLRPTAIGLVIAALITVVATVVTAPFDPRY